MPPLNYQQVNVVLAEPKAEMSTVLHTALYPRGLRHVTICRDFAGLVESMNESSVDVLLCDLQLGGTKFRETMQKIRHNEVGRNPFVHIIAMIGVSGRDTVSRVIGAGVDDLIRKPMPPARLVARFENLAKPRKPFVVAEEYVGPNRRKGARISEGYSLLQVPNSLRAKAFENIHPTQVQDAIDRAWAEVLDKQSRIRRNAITVLATRILKYYDGQGTEQDLRRDLKYLVGKAEELIGRHRNTDSQHVAEIAACMGAVALRIMRSPQAPSRTDVKLMPHLSDATRISAQSPKQSIKTVREIAGLIRDYLAMQARADANS